MLVPKRLRKRRKNNNLAYKTQAIDIGEAYLHAGRPCSRGDVFEGHAPGAEEEFVRGINRRLLLFLVPER
jgi:hypothetical protein